MLFNSIDFAIFLPVVFIIYWLLKAKNINTQNAFLLMASYIFYGWWDWRFLSLIIFSSLIDFFVGLQLSRTEEPLKRKILLLISLCVNLGFLGFFKYYNFFLENFILAFQFFGQSISSRGLHIILPVGISFYTFQTLSYSIDIYRRKLEPTRDIVAFFAFVAFFPQLVAGPIERATNLLPQFEKKRIFEYDKAVDGMRQILWGFFKKIVIADNCAIYVNEIFSNYSQNPGSTLFLGVVFFAFQIYGDFSGYSDIAIGTARLFGFSLMRNFAFPYFSRDIAEFWRRWHISLSSWFRDYVYIPLGGSRGRTWEKIRNIFIIFIVSGFWHGANWTFIIWGALNAIYFLPLMLLRKNRTYTGLVAQNRLLPNFKETVQMGLTFFLTLIALIFFRSAGVGQAIEYISGMFSPSILSVPQILSIKLCILICAIILFMWIEFFQRDKEHALQFRNQAFPILIRWSIYAAIVLSIIWLRAPQQEFIYFQF